MLSSVLIESIAAPERVVPHNTDEVTALVEQAVDALWPGRHDIERWELLRPQLTGDDSASVDARSRAVYRRLLFDVTAETIGLLCAEPPADPDADEPWRRRRIATPRPVPQSADEARPLVTATVLDQLCLESSQPTPVPRHLGQFRGRRPADRADEVIDADLVREEWMWTDYGDDEVSVKHSIADRLFGVMVGDTVGALSLVVARKRRRAASSSA